MYCPSCGTQNAETSRFCIKCGNALPSGEGVGRPSALAQNIQSSPQSRPHQRNYFWIGLIGVVLLVVFVVLATVASGGNGKPISIASASPTATAALQSQPAVLTSTSAVQPPTATPTTSARTTVAPTPIQLEVADSPGRLAYSSVACDGKAGFDIYAMNADGTEQTKLNSSHFGGTLYSLAPVSPDGKNLLFVSGDSGKLGDLYVAEINSSTKTTLAGGVFAGGALGDLWSPDGAQVAFMMGKNKSSSCQPLCNSEIYVAKADGSGILNVTNDPAKDIVPSWSPDGKRIAFARWSGSYPDKLITENYVINADGTGLTRLSHHEQQPSERATTDILLLWSPDGQRIAFARRTDPDENATYVMNADGSNQLKLPINGAIVSWSWSRDSQWILINIQTNAGSSMPSFRIMRIRPDGSGLTQLVDGMFPAWSLDGKKIGYTLMRVAPDGKSFSSDIYVMNADGSDPTRLTNTPECEVAYRWIP